MIASARSAPPPAELVACPDCDLLQRLPDPAAVGHRRCVRCDAVLYRQVDTPPERVMALLVTGALLLLMANSFPIVTLESGGMRVPGTLLGAVTHLWEQGMVFLALLVLATTVVVPVIELALLLLVLRRAAPPARLLAWLEHLRPWAMVDVFVLAALVSIKKLADLADLIVGPALWAWCALMILTIAARTGTSLHALWQRVPVRGLG